MMDFQCPMSSDGHSRVGFASATQHRVTLFLEFVSFHSLLGEEYWYQLPGDPHSPKGEPTQSREISRSLVSGLMKAMLQKTTGCFRFHEASF